MVAEHPRSRGSVKGAPKPAWPFPLPHPGTGEISLMVLLATALLIGGGGVRYGLFNLAVQLLAIGILAFNRAAVTDFVGRAPRPLLILLAASLLLPMLQLIPLPPAVWLMLPGRDLVFQSLFLVGAADSWFTLSVDSNRTLVAFMALLPVAAVLVLASRLPREGLVRTLWLIVLLALVNVALGVAQLGGSGRLGHIYPEGLASQLHGTFASHNAAGLFLVITLCVLAGMPVRETGRQAGLLVRAIIGVVLVLCVILTQSRSATVLLFAPFGILLWRTVFHARHAAVSRLRPWLLLAVVGMIVGAVALLSGNTQIRQTVSRFDDLGDNRAMIWEDSLASAQRFWPVGAGMGTFDEVFQVDESLETLQRARAGRAHNDFLEVAIEAGVPGILLIAGWLGWICLAAIRARARAGTMWPLAAAAFVGLLCIAAQSLLDYPLRNQAQLCVAALLVAVLVRYSMRDKLL